MRALVRGCAVLLVSCALLGCGDDDDAAPPVEPPDTPKRDAGNGSEPFDADVPLPRADAGKIPVEPGDPDPGLMGGCAIDSNKIFTVAERSRPFLSTPLSVDSINSRFALPYVNDDGCHDAVHWTSLSGAATSGAPKSTMALDNCALVRDVVTTSVGNGRWLVGMVDNRQPPYDLWVAAYDADENQSGDAARISENSHVETGIALATLRSGDKAMVAWADEDLREGQDLYVRMLDALGRPAGDAVKLEHSSDLYYHGLGLKPLGDGASLVYWRYSLDYKTSDLVFVALDSSGKPLREAWIVAAKAGPSASIDVVADAEGGGIVYARAEAQTGRQIWFQQIDADGQAALQRTGNTRAPALRMVNAPQRGIDVSITKLRTTFIVTYRALPATAEGQATLRLYFLDRFGAVVGSSDVSYTSAAGGRTAVQSANDGRVVIGWSQVNEDGTSVIKLVRLPCLGG